MRFTKMHGTANDYVYINCFEEKFDRFDLIPTLSDRRCGIGGDGVILILPSKIADVRMRMFNADGSEAEMCGNGARCVAWYAYSNGLIKEKKFKLETKAGIKAVEIKDDELVEINMGKPLEVQKDFEVEGYNGTYVSVGNPHFITFVGDTESFPVHEVGAKLEVASVFPNRANIEFVEQIDEMTLKMRVWERGSGETLSCGTGATAVFVASNMLGRVGDEACVKILGGDLFFRLDKETGEVYMTGNAIEVYKGEIEIG